MADPTPSQAIGTALRNAVIANFQACTGRELERLHRPPEQTELAAAVAARYRRALRELARQIVATLRDVPAGELREKVGALAKAVRAKPDEVGDGTTLDVLRDAIDAIEADAVMAIEHIEAGASTKEENRWPPVGALVLLVSFCLLFLYGVERLTPAEGGPQQTVSPTASSTACPPIAKNGQAPSAKNTDPPQTTSIAGSVKCSPPPKDVHPVLRPVLRGMVMIIQIAAVLGIAALIVAVLRAMRITAAERLSDALFDRAKDAAKGAPAGAGPSLLTTLVSAKGLAIAAAATGVAAAGAENLRQNPSLDAKALEHEIAAGVTRAVNQALEKLDAKSVNTAAAELDKAATKLADAAKLLPCNTSECKSATPVSQHVTLALDKALTTNLTLTLALDADSRKALGEFAGKQPDSALTQMNQSIVRLGDRVDTLVKANDDGRLDFVKAYSYTNDRLWRLCFETHRFADAVSTLRNGLVNFAAGEQPARIRLDCRNIIAPPPPPPPLPTATECAER